MTTRPSRRRQTVPPQAPFTTEPAQPINIQLTAHLTLVVDDAGNAWPIFNERRRHIGEAHNLRSHINELSKLGVKLLDIDEGEIPPSLAYEAEQHQIAIALNGLVVADSVYEEIEREQRKLYERLSGLNLSGTLKWRLQNEAGQEMYEFVSVRLLWQSFMHDRDFPGLPAHDDLGISIEALLAGLGDVPGEFGKRLNTYLIEKNSPRTERMRLRQRFLDEIALPVLKKLSEFENAYPLAINASDRFRYSFRFNVLGNVKREIGRHQELLLQDKAGQADR
ncbi:hypothetical protein HY573_01915 [Candidatus Parcubacteria bacterium]|nr:hypothetical protein [Candidatus Parcubacteria bacterium]